MRRPRPFVLGRALVKEMLPTLLMAAGVSTFLLLIRALFVVADLFISRSVGFPTVARLLFLGVPNILALTLPIGTLFAVLMTSARWAADSELVAMQACGVPLRRVAVPLIAVAGVVFAVDAALTLGVMPQANAQLSELTRKVALSAANAAIEQRVFAEDFPNQLLYVDKIDRGTGRWHGILLFDNSNPDQESLVTADSGNLVIDPRDGSAWLNLRDTTTHLLRPNEPDSYRKNDNNELRIRLRQGQTGAGHQQTHLGVRETSTGALLRRASAPAAGNGAELAREARVELNKRVAIPAAAVVFALVGFPLGIRNRRGGKGYGLTASVALVVAYYVLLNNGELLATGGKVPVAVGMWLPNLALLVLGALLFRRAARGEAGGVPFLTRVGDVSRTIIVGPFRAAAAAVRRLWSGRGSAARDGTDDGLPTRVPAPLGVVDQYLLRQCLSFFVLVVIAVCALWIAVDLSGNLEDIRRNSVPLVTVASYYLMSLPQILHDTLPFAFLISFLATAAVLERRNESTAFKAAGISLSRIALPLLLLGMAVGTGLFFLDNQVTQRAERAKQQLEDILRGRKVARSYRATDRPYVFLPDGRTLVNFLEFDPDTNTLIRPSVFVFDQRFNLRTRFMARRATFVDGHWRAEGAWSRTFMADATPEFVTYPGSVDLPLSVSPAYFGREYRRPDQMSFNELRRYIATLHAAGYRVDRLMVQLNQKIAYPFSLVLLPWLALSFAFKPGRSRSAIGGIALALVLGMAYFGLMALVNQFGDAGLVPPVLAAWTPTVVFALLALNRHTTLRT